MATFEKTFVSFILTVCIAMITYRSNQISEEERNARNPTPLGGGLVMEIKYQALPPGSMSCESGFMSTDEARVREQILGGCHRIWPSSDEIRARQSG